MILLDRIRRSLLLMAVVFGLLACEDPSEVGLSLNSDGTQIGVFFEEISLPVTNVFIDSLRTDGDRRLLVGEYNDPVFGSTAATAVSQLIPSTFSFTVKDDSLTDADEEVFDYEIDSVILQLRYNYFHGSDFTQDQTIEVKQINDTLFTGVSYFAHFPSPVDDAGILYGQGTFRVDPELDTLLKINLDAFGTESLNFLRSTSVGALSRDSLINQIKGIALIPSPSNSVLIGFDPADASTKLSVYYKIIQVQDVVGDPVITDSLTIDFNFTSAVRYNSISTDRSTSELSIIKDNLAAFDANNGKVYLQSGSGIYPRIDFTPFQEFLDNQPNIIINRTDIVVPIASDVIKPTYINNVDDLRFFITGDSSNIDNNSSSIILTNTSYFGAGVTIAAQADLNEDDNTYEVETSLFSQLMNAGGISAENLVLAPTDLTSMNQTIFDNSGVKVKVFYTVPN